MGGRGGIGGVFGGGGEEEGGGGGGLSTEYKHDFELGGGTSGVDLNYYNARLRAGGSMPGDIVAKYNEAFSKNRTLEDIVYYRGVGIGELARFARGGTITDRGYTFLTRSRNIANQFGEALVRVTVPKGTGILRADQFVKNPDRTGLGGNEFLLNKNTTFRINGISEVNGRTVVDVTIT